MIVLKANPQLKTVFNKLIRTAKEPVEWSGVFLAAGNNLILLGSLRSLFFSLENRKVFSNIIDFTVNEENTEDTQDNAVLANVLNMMLYAFGKWGAVSGLKVDKDYGQLNRLFANILKEINVEAQFREDSFYFLKDGIRMTYEEVVQRAVEWGKDELLDEESGEAEEKLGLWHSMRWETQKLAFSKGERTQEDEKRGRLGKNFYMTGYVCPGCGKKLYMVVYPAGREFLIETDEERVFLARAYTCPECRRYYTPRPERLLREGDVYTLSFEEDAKAYEDYLELLGRSGERCCNYNFNQYESKRDAGASGEQETLAKACEGLNGLPVPELEELAGMLEEGFFPWEEAKEYQAGVEKTLFIKKRMEARRERMRKENGRPYGSVPGLSGRSAGPESEASGAAAASESAESAGAVAASEIAASPEADAGMQDASGGPGKPEGPANGEDQNSTHQEAAGREDLVREEPVRDMADMTQLRQGPAPAESSAAHGQSAAELKKLYEEKINGADGLSYTQLKQLRQEIVVGKTLAHEEKEDFLRRLDGALGRLEEKEVLRKAEACRGKSYSEINRTVYELENGEYSKDTAGPVVFRLKELRRLRGEREVKQLVDGLPAAVTQAQYRAVKGKLAEYRDVDTSLQEELLEEKRDAAQKQEISLYIDKAPKRTRGELVKLYEDLKQRGYKECNAAPFLDKIHEKLCRMDEAEIERICPSVFGITFEQGLEAFQKIEEGDFLPEIKVKTLEMLAKRLTKMKADENTQLVRKLRREIEESLSDRKGLHFYDAAGMQDRTRGPEEEEERQEEQDGRDAIINALDTYALERGKYEFPILIADSSRAANGREGFVLTPDHIFYKAKFHSGVIDVGQVEGITAVNGLFKKGLTVLQSDGDSRKIPCAAPAAQCGILAKILGDFTSYLKEKPESRKISYLAKESHEVKICYRCGYRFRDGDVCPKCGSKANR